MILKAICRWFLPRGTAYMLLTSCPSLPVKVLPEAVASGHNADLNSNPGTGGAATSPVCQEEVEMRAALQFLMRHMVKRAVMRSPIKRALGLGDLERAQAMVYKLVVSGLLEEPSVAKAKSGGERLSDTSMSSASV